MSVRRSHPLRRLAPFLLPLALLLLAACDIGTQQNTFDPSGEVADKQRDLFNLVLWPAVVILIIVEGGLIYALLRFRRKENDELPKQVHGNPRLELAWTIAPAILLLVLAVPTVATIVDLGRAPAADALKIRVTGFQWNWQFEYLDPQFATEDGNPLKIIGQCPADCAELHIPVGREIGVELQAADVVHSFWVPKLAGKLDVIPGRTNRMWFSASQPGSFSGQCAEFCGLGHADMRLMVVAESEEDFQDWITDQLEGAGAASAGPDEPALVSQGE